MCYDCFALSTANRRTEPGGASAAATFDCVINARSLNLVASLRCNETNQSAAFANGSIRIKIVHVVCLEVNKHAVPARSPTDMRLCVRIGMAIASCATSYTDLLFFQQRIKGRFLGIPGLSICQSAIVGLHLTTRRYIILRLIPAANEVQILHLFR